MKVTAQFTAVVPDPDTRLWRCTQCGKWSHAKKKPQTHKRWIGDEGVWPQFVACGPFETWLARKVVEETSGNAP